PKQLITHHFSLNDIIHAYDVFSNAAEEQAIKLILVNDVSCVAAPKSANGSVQDAMIKQIVAQVLKEMG
ncbi:MAG: hypothetical protein KDJ97_38410, partial [Anaerolineae bacterium]|nr:hypothetical protein [Anaerolineae bacterium]